MTATFRFRTTPHFDRLVRRLHRHHGDLAGRYAEALETLQTDPLNRSGARPTRKLEAIRAPNPPRRDQGDHDSRTIFQGHSSCWLQVRTTFSSYRAVILRAPLGRRTATSSTEMLLRVGLE